MSSRRGAFLCAALTGASTSEGNAIFRKRRLLGAGGDKVL